MNFLDVISATKKVLFPVLCPACDMHEPLKGEPFCNQCLHEVSWIKTSADARAALIGKDYFPEDIDYFNSLIYYTKSGKAQRIFKSIKYWGDDELAYDLGAKLGKSINEESLAGALLIPVPLHRRRFKERSYNQAEEIAKGVTSTYASAQVYTSLLKRNVYETSQTHKSKKQRSQVLSKSFSLGEINISLSTHICLVDDVITTGSTIGACTSLLRSAGFTNISVLSLAISI